MARQRKKSNPVINAIIFGIFGIIMLFMGVRTFAGLHGKLLNISTCDPSEIKSGVYIEASLITGYGAYVEKTTTYNHIITKTDGYYYLVDVCDQNEDGSPKDSAKWIGVTISKSAKDKYDAISTDENAEPIKITGVIKANSSEVQGYLEDYITNYVDMYAKYYGYTASASDYEAAKAEALPYYIKPVGAFDYGFEFVLGSVFVLLAVIQILIAVKRRKSATQTIGGAYSPYSDGASQTDYFQGTPAQNIYQTGNAQDMYQTGNAQDMYQTGNAQNMTASDTGNASADQTPYADPFYNSQSEASSSSSFSLKKDDM